MKGRLLSLQRLQCCIRKQGLGLVGCSWVPSRYDDMLSVCPGIQEGKGKGLGPRTCLFMFLLR